MSMTTLPLVFINLGGEMLYILDQRLRAQKTAEDNTQKVMNDIIATMFNKAFMEELLKPQDVYSHRALRTVLTRLAHASIMRLNQASMDRLYELMVMAFKYQLLLCPRPRDLLLISYNHIDAIREFVRNTPSVLNQVDETHRKIIEVYTPLSDGELQLLRQTLLIFLQDMHVRVSFFLKDKVQNPNGRFVLSTTGPVPHGTEVPGLIRVFSRSGREIKRLEFPTEGNYTIVGSTLYNETRYNLLIYIPAIILIYPQTNSEPNPLAKEELNLLARLMGRMEILNQNNDSEIGFRVSLFSTEQEEKDIVASGRSGDPSFEVINIQATQDTQVNKELARIAGEFTKEVEEPEPPDGPSNKGEDLLTMMDELV
uniref:Organic solute carrier partner 1a n=1 Tax=Esox lucius TaxID=8010 RepID=A0A3P8ZN50_ESOLU